MADFPPTRASLLLRLRDPQDETAWSEFVDLYAPLVYGYARKRGLQDADAADLTQDVLGAVAGAMDRLDYDPARGAFRNWLFTVVRRKLINWRAGRNGRPVGSGDESVYRMMEQCPNPTEEASEWDAEWEERVFAWACAQVRRDVSETTWQAFGRTAIEDQSGKQTAGDLGLSVAAVYRARSRVLARLKALVQSVQEPP